MTKTISKCPLCGGDFISVYNWDRLRKINAIDNEYCAECNFVPDRLDIATKREYSVKQGAE